MARAGLRGLEFYDPVTRMHGQAHMQARSVISATHAECFLTCSFCSLGITQYLIKGGIASLEEVQSADGVLENLYIRVRVIRHVSLGGLLKPGLG